MPVIQEQAGLTLDSIVVATDFTPESEKALNYARALARQFASRLTVAHVIDHSVDQVRHDSAENIERMLYDLGSDGVTAQGKTVESANPAHALVQLSETMEADLLVVGTHNRHGVSKLLLGSCSEGVINSASCPVLTVGPNADPRPDDVVFRSIVFATDLKRDSIERTADALAFAKDSIVDVHICHVIEDHVESFADAFRQHARAECALSKLIADASYTWCNPKPSILFGEVDREILSIANAIHADLIVLGAHRGPAWLMRFWEGVAEQVIGRAPCPVLTIPS